MSHDRPPVLSDPDAEFHDRIRARFLRNDPMAKKKPESKPADAPDFDALVAEAHAATADEPHHVGAAPLSPFLKDFGRQLALKLLDLAPAALAALRAELQGDAPAA